jgi:hypothetical protein
MTVRYDIKQVTRYILTRTMNTDKGATVADLAEFKRRDDAERVMGTMRAAIHPVEVAPKTLSEVRAEDRKRTAREDACIRINGDIAIALAGLDALDTTRALELLESRVANAKKVWQNRVEEAAK